MNIWCIFEQIHPNIKYQALAYWKSHNNFYEGFSVAKSLSSGDMLRFSAIVENQEKNEDVNEKWRNCWEWWNEENHLIENNEIRS